VASARPKETALRGREGQVTRERGRVRAARSLGPPDVPDRPRAREDASSVWTVSSPSAPRAPSPGRVARMLGLVEGPLSLVGRAARSVERADSGGCAWMSWSTVRALDFE